MVAADKNQEILIRSEFHDIAILRMEGYGISYSRKKAFFLWKLFMQLPKIYSAAKKEKKWVKKMADEHQFDAIISDNRLGFYNKKIPSVFITHQLSVQTGFTFIDAIVRKIYYSYINRFSECWIPDAENNDFNLAGILSHPKSKPDIPVKYLGALSRFEKIQTESNNKVLIVISGPEPQRTVFEEIILKQLPTSEQKIILVRGLPESNSMPDIELSHVTIFNHLSSMELNQLMQKASVIITRAGYSTIMDLTAIGKNAILVPTPGQTEQEYLAQHLMEKNYFISKQQKEFVLSEAIEEAEKFEFKKLPEIQFNSGVILEWLATLS